MSELNFSVTARTLPIKPYFLLVKLFTQSTAKRSLLFQPQTAKVACLAFDLFSRLRATSDRRLYGSSIDSSLPCSPFQLFNSGGAMLPNLVHYLTFQLSFEHFSNCEFLKVDHI